MSTKAEQFIYLFIYLFIFLFIFFSINVQSYNIWSIILQIPIKFTKVIC